MGVLETMLAPRPGTNGMTFGGVYAAPVAVLAYVYPPENSVGALRPARFVRYLRTMGHDVAVLAAAPDGLQETDPKVQRFTGKERAHRSAAALGAVLGATQNAMLPFNDRLGWVPQAVARAMELLARNPDTVVLSTFPPVATHVAGLVIKLRTGAPWIADFRDPLLGNPSRVSRRASVLDPVLERAIFTNADAIIANTEAMAALFRKRYPRAAERIHVIWNGMDPDAQPAGIALATAAPDNARSITHVGTIYAARAPDQLAASLERLVTSGAVPAGTVSLRLIGPVENNATERAREAAPNLHQSGALHIANTLLPRHEARAEMSRADILLLLELTHADATPLQLPAKIFEYLETGRPIMAWSQPNSPTAHILARAGVNHTLIDPRGSPAEIDAAVLAMLKTPSDIKFPTPEFLRDFDARAQTATVSRLIHSLAERVGGAR